MALGTDMHCFISFQFVLVIEDLEGINCSIVGDKEVRKSENLTGYSLSIVPGCENVLSHVFAC